MKNFRLSLLVIGLLAGILFWKGHLDEGMILLFAYGLYRFLTD